MRAIAPRLTLCILTAATACADVTLVRDGEPVAVIVHMGQPGCQEAAEELQYYIREMSGAVLPIQWMQPVELESAYYEGKQLLALAVGEQTAWQFGLDVPALRPEGFYQMCDAGSLLGVLGKDPQGLMFGVYDLLEQLGVRWYLPTELGEEIPQRATIQVGALSNAEAPDFILRDMWLAYGDRPADERADYELWRRHNKMGGVRAQMGHNLFRIIGPAQYAETHPEYFPLIDGQRLIPEAEHNWQPCTSNPDVVRIAAEAARAAFDADPNLWSFSLSPNDGWTGWCECEDCVALDPPEFRGDPRHGKARRMLVFANAVAELLAQTHPGRRVCFYAYAPTVEPPADLQAHSQVAVAVAHYGAVSDQLRPITDPNSPRNAGYIPLVEGWARVTDQILAREYWTALVPETDGIARVATAWALAEDIPWYRDHKIIGISSEALSIWGSCGLNFYLAAKLMWDADADVAAILDDYFTGMYGPAAPPMREYFETIRDLARQRYLKGELFADADFPPLRALLDQALALAQTDKQRARVQLSLDHFEYVLLLRQMHLTASEEAFAAVEHFVAEHPDSLGFDRTMHRRSIAAPRHTEIPRELRYDGPPITAASDEPVPPEALVAAPAVRHTAVYLIAPRRGEPFTVTIRPRRMGRYLDPTGASLRTLDGTEVATANVGPTAEQTLEVGAADVPFYVLLVNAGANAAAVTCDAQAFVLASIEPHFVGPTPRMYFLTRPGAEQVEVGLTTEAPGEIAQVTVWDARGEQVGWARTGPEETVRVQAAVPADQRPAVWSLRIDKVPEGYIEDAQVSLRGALPYLATDPARLVHPIE
ncbi:MAG: DUF4838 domain-containing protein [Armatimonadota bacterium]